MDWLIIIKRVIYLWCFVIGGLHILGSIGYMAEESIDGNTDGVIFNGFMLVAMFLFLILLKI